MTKNEALQLALEALHGFIPYLPLDSNKPQCDKYDQAITAIKEALETKDEPVAWATREDFYRELEHAMNRMRQQMEIKSVTMRCTDYYIALPVIDIFDGRILVGQVTTPPQRTWVGLTDEEIKLLSAEWRIVYGAWMDDFAKDIEAKLKQKNGYAEEKNT